MDCGKCNNHVHDCTCDDLEFRLDSVKEFAYKRCSICLKHYERCRCKVPIWIVTSGGEEIDVEIPE